MEPSLFKNRPLSRGRTVIMVIGALSIHGAIVGVGAVFWQPTEKPVEIPTTEVDLPPPGESDVQQLIVSLSAPTPMQDVLAPPPEGTPPPDESPAPNDVPDMQAPTPLPKPKLTAKYVGASALFGAKRGRFAQPGSIGGNENGTKSIGVPGGSEGSVGWSMPHPPYPSAAAALHIQGSTTVAITTDAAGRVSSVEITRSAGNAVLDFYTKRYVRDNWKGPPNSTRTTAFDYVMH